MEKRKENMGTRDFLLNVLRDGGITPKILDECTLLVEYSNWDTSSTIIIECDNNTEYIQLSEENWLSVPKWDIDKVSKYQGKANSESLHNDTHVTYDFDGDEMVISTTVVRFFSESVEKPFEYLKEQLDAIIQAKMSVRACEKTDWPTVSNHIDVEEREEERDEENEDDDSTDFDEELWKVEHTATTNIVVQTLKELQCEPTLNDEPWGCDVDFEYQGEEFRIYCQENQIYLYDRFWFTFDAYDIDTLSRVKRVLNEINKQSAAGVGYYYNEEVKQFGVHTHSTLYCSKDIDFKEHLKEELHDCFMIQRYFFSEVYKPEGK